MALFKFVAIYTMAYKIASVLKLVIVDSIKMALTPMVFQRRSIRRTIKDFTPRSMLYTSFVLMLGNNYSFSFLI